jgi:hypothetical protein
VLWTGLLWLRIGTGGELLWTRWWTFGFHKMLGIYRVGTQLVASRMVLSSTELVTSVSTYESQSTRWVPFLCFMSCSHVQNPVTCVSIDFCNPVYKFLLWVPLPAADAERGVSGGLLHPLQHSLSCSCYTETGQFLQFTPLTFACSVLDSGPTHCDCMLLWALQPQCIQYTTFGFSFHFFSNMLLHEEWCLLGCYAVWLL